MKLLLELPDLDFIKVCARKASRIRSCYRQAAWSQSRQRLNEFFEIGWALVESPCFSWEYGKPGPGDCSGFQKVPSCLHTITFPLVLVATASNQATSSGILT